MQTKYPRHRGVTLIELLTVLVIIAILAAIAYPSYRDFIIRSQRADARTALLSVQAAEEKHMLKNNVYTGDITSANGLGLSLVSEHGLYQIGVDPLPTDTTIPYQNGYIAKAVPLPGKGQDQDLKCGTLTIDNVGNKGTTGTATPAECWR